eukprot:9469814-Pyramimonas_sp.AAC.1
MAELMMPSWFKKRDGPSGGGQSSGGTGPKAHKTDDKGKGAKGAKDMMRVVEMIVRLLLTATRELADVASSVFLRWDIALDRGLPAQLIVAGKGYDEESKSMKAKQAAGEDQDFKGRGPPHIHIFAAAMKYCASRTPTAGPTQGEEEALLQQAKDWWQ